MIDDPKLVSYALYFDQPVMIACDALCEKAWGVMGRPRRDDDTMLTDGELEVAPIDPGTAEGGQSKPFPVPTRHNKWCVRECERSVMVRLEHRVALPDFSP